MSANGVTAGAVPVAQGAPAAQPAPSASSSSVATIVAICLGFWFSEIIKWGLPYLTTEPVTAAGVGSIANMTPLDYGALQSYVDTHSRADLRWGTYHSGLYYGIRSRTFPFYLSAGLLWGSQHEDVSQLRHWCRQEDRLQKYGWLQHDGRTFGHQTVEDQHNRLLLDTYYMRLTTSKDKQAPPDEQLNGWASRFSVSHLEPRDERIKRQPVDKTKTSLFFYVDLGCGDESLDNSCRKALFSRLEVAEEPAPCANTDAGWTCTQAVFESDGSTRGATPELDVGDAPLAFQLLVQLKARDDLNLVELRFSGIKDTNVVNVKDRILRYAERSEGSEDEEVYLDNIVDEEATILVVQAIVEAPTARFEPSTVFFDVLFQEGSDEYVSLDSLNDLVSEQIAARTEQFSQRFEETFDLAAKSFNDSQVAFAQAAFSNLIGGMGYFYGSSLIQRDPNSPTVEESPPKPLFTAVPSRSFFPRGFLWDEGFHQMGIFPFDEEIPMDAIAHWFGLMEEDGYIAREQILGQMARLRVPAEFLVQHVEHANPPTLLLCVEKMLRQGSSAAEQRKYIELIYPFMERWYNWFVTTQHGPNTEENAALRWRGRRANDGKLISNTLSSGLDDYPRASLPTNREMHVDLLCWMIRASDILATIADMLGHRNKKYFFQSNKARFLEALDRYHWHDGLKSYFDIGDHSDDGHIEYQVAIRCRDEHGGILDTTAPLDRVRTREVHCPASHPMYLFPLGDGQGGLKLQQVFIPGTMRLQHIKHIGYVSIFPLLLKVLPPDSPKLKALLDQLTDPTHLWSPFGLRSLSTTDMFYERENAPGDNPYWRGSIWINANYLALEALHYYSQESLDSPYQKEFRAAYVSLRDNVVNAIYREYERTGYLWEQYNGNAQAEGSYGNGQRCHPFSGWTALVVNIMAEKY
ncbi:TPA: hypothetical protein N0F65_007906 [Lagenidium giganteum]|uniref:Mannosyl-oligosaccharide glucosidase n=1 Tax=Lagenidium giganteum TaxID=4803 RepID=A0AAV2Z0U0_9STRA|nr:TPA: hypothetical protein N0F65_007906 [Lagenidium giganteum]